MPEALASWPAPVVSWALTYLLHSTVIIGLAWGLTRLAWLRGPGTQEVIWTVALLGGLTTSLAAPLDPMGSQPTSAELEVTVVRAARDAPPFGTPLDRLEWQRAEGGWLPSGEGLGEACRRALVGGVRGGRAWLRSVRTACASGGAAGWMVALLGLWLAGAALLVGGEARRHGTLRRVRRSFGHASPRVTSALRRLVAGTRVEDTVRVTVSGEVDAPCVVDSSTVVLPPRCHDELADAELLAVLAHEVAHIRRRDVRRQTLYRLVAAVLWLQPLNRLALRRLHDVAELICDDWAVGRIPEALDLARSISRVAEWSVPVARRKPVLAGSQGGRLSERVRRILASRAGGSSGGRLRGGVVATALVVALTQLPSVAVPGGVRGIFVLREQVEVDTVVHEVRVRLRSADF